MLDLVARSEPGPFERRTVELGNYFGLRREGKLVAMAGERLNPPGWREISAVTTDPSHRRKGFAGRLIRAVAHEIVERGETPLLHVDSRNAGAIRLYQSIGFAIRRRPTFFLLRAPEPA
nr:GNAT family N-acetyltransferase [Kineosporia babensis]